MALSSYVFVFGVVAGAVMIIALEALGLIIVINRMNKKAKKEEAMAKRSKKKWAQLDPHQSLDFTYIKQGSIWILESGKIGNLILVDKAPKERKRKKEYLEVSPVKKHAQIKNKSLIVLEADGSSSMISLKGCVIEAVSASNLSSRKWAKKYPIKVESKMSVLYNGSKIFYIYLNTSWEKESWCKALRLASCNDKERLNWVSKLNEEFHHYLTSLNTGHPSLMKPKVGFYPEPVDKGNRCDGSSSKVRKLWEKILKKSIKSSAKNKSGHLDRKVSGRFLPVRDSVSAPRLTESVRTVKTPNSSMEDYVAIPFSSTFTRSGSHSSVISDADSDHNSKDDEGTLCWNLLISRLFFDAKSSKEMKSSIQARLQRTLSSMRTPSFIGEVTCTDIHMGNLPPCIHHMRVLPMEMNEIWALEVDIEYPGGIILDVETRLEVCELDVQKGLLDSEANSVAEVPSDLLEGFECLGEQLNISDRAVGSGAQKHEGDLKQDGAHSSKSTAPASNAVSMWKSILNSVAKQVSQVPISLSIKVAHLRGTVRLHFKPPPSDELWIGFTSMPDIDFKLESSFGEHKINSGHVALFLISRFKAAIRETLVLPNCESVCIPWMLAEKDNWVPRRVAPFIWVHREDHTTVCEKHDSISGEVKSKKEASRGNSNDPSKHTNSEKLECVQQQKCESLEAVLHLPHSTSAYMQRTMSSQDLLTPLLDADKKLGFFHGYGKKVPEFGSSSRSITLYGENHAIKEDDSKPKRIGGKERMLELRKKMREKLEEKRRNIEEKGRNIVEKMRGP